MIKKILTHKLTSTASSDCALIGLKIADGGADFRVAGLLLFLVSVTTLLFSWHHQASASVAGLKTSSKKQEPRCRRKHRR